MKNTKLHRSLSLFSITMYGIGSILGAGIYVLVGKVSGHAGIFAPASFLVAAIVATFTAISYANLSSSIPKSGGEFAYISKAFKSEKFALLIACGVMLSGSISSATMANGFVGYLQVFTGIHASIIISAFVLILGALSIWGIQQSAFLVTAFAFIEFAGLIFVVYCLHDNTNLISSRLTEAISDFNFSTTTPILAGSFIAFFAFIGFEDMVNIAEEVKNPKRNMYLSIIFALIVTSTIYILISLFASISLTPEQLQNSTAPMADLIASKGYNPKIISVVSLFSISNGAIVQMVMAARILFSISRKGIIPKIFSNIHSETRTPIYATLLIILFILFLALFLELETLAEMASFVILLVFTTINISWFLIQRSMVERSLISVTIPIAGAITSFGMVVFKLYTLI
ncbi:MAG: amino acid permease [Rickettsiales bacterium]